MDVRLLLFDAETMRQICRDAAKDLGLLPVQMPLWGAGPLAPQADPAPARAALESAARGGPLWVLQWCTLVLVYLSETLAAALQNGTPPHVHGPWFAGRASASLEPFRSRLELMLGGEYSPKTKRGARKDVARVAMTPLEIVASEVLLLHTLSAAGPPA